MRKKEEIKPGDFVSYDDFGYRYASGLDEDGFGEIEDFHYISHGKVLSVGIYEHQRQALVWFFRRIGGVDVKYDTMILDAMFSDWVPIEKLTAIDEPNSFNVYENTDPIVEEIRLRELELQKSIEDSRKNILINKNNVERDKDWLPF